MTVKEIHTALNNGKKVYWHSEGYQVFKIPVREHYREHDTNHVTHLDGQILEIIYTSNWWGGLAHEKELKDCYVK